MGEETPHRDSWLMLSVCAVRMEDPPDKRGPDWQSSPGIPEVLLHSSVHGRDFEMKKKDVDDSNAVESVAFPP